MEGENVERSMNDQMQIIQVRTEVVMRRIQKIRVGESSISPIQKVEKYGKVATERVMT